MGLKNAEKPSMPLVNKDPSLQA